jgi:hypothetical protein
MDVWLIDQELRAHGEHVLLPPQRPGAVLHRRQRRQHALPCGRGPVAAL